MLSLVIWPNMMLLGWTETELWTLKNGSKSIQTSLIMRQRPLKPYKLLKFFMISVILFKMSQHRDFHFIFFQIEGAWEDFIVVTKLLKNCKILYGSGGRFLKIRDVCMYFEPYFKVHNLVSVYPKSIIFCQMTKSQHDLSCGGVSLSISWNLKLAPVPWWISERPIAPSTLHPRQLDSTAALLFLAFFTFHTVSIWFFTRLQQKHILIHQISRTCTQELT